MKYLRLAADLLRPTDMLSLRAVALNNLGEVHLDLGDLDAAEECCAEARDIWREIGGYGEGWALHNLGRVYLALGRIDDAATSLTDAINAHRASGELAGQATALKYLGHARLAAGDLGRGAELVDAGAVDIRADRRARGGGGGGRVARFAAAFVTA